MKTQRKNKQNRWSFEQLEQRQLLTGNVTADASTGALIIIGDDASNIIAITQVSANTFKVTGAATAINGTSSAKTFSNVTGGIFINMNGGNDTVGLKGLNIQGESGEIGLGVILGAGNDTFGMTNVTVAAGCAIDGGSGNNVIGIDQSQIGYCLGIQTGDGIDAIVIGRTTVFGALTVTMGNGVNSLTMIKDNVSQEVTYSGDGSLPEGFESLKSIFAEIDCGAEITGGSSVDAIAMSFVQIDCETEINTFGGVDSVAITNSRFGNAPVVPVLAPASVGIKQIGSENSGLCIETGWGNDAVAINATTVYGFLQIDTSGDYDCPTDEICCEIRTDSASPAQEEIPSGKDGIDAVVLNNVQVLQSDQGRCLSEWCDWIEEVHPSVTDSTWFECCCELSVLESGMLLIYTGNQTDAVTLNKVTTDAQASIYTTDESNLDGTDAVAITNSSFNRQNEVMEHTTLPLIVINTGLTVETGNGNDVVTVAKVNVVGKTFIDSDGGTDVVSLVFLNTDELCVQVGDGNRDVLTVSNCSAIDEVFADNGGTNGLLNFKHLNNHFVNQPNIFGFATVV